MARIVAYYATTVNEKVSCQLNDGTTHVSYDPHMRAAAKIHAAKKPNKIQKIHATRVTKRIHYLAEWLEHRQLNQADLVSELGVNKGTVSKWCAGDLPSEKNLLSLTAFLEIEPPALFRHPLDDWMSRLFKQRSEDELKRMVETLKAAFPQKSGTHG